MVAGRYKKERKRETITQPNGTTHLQHAIVGDKHAATSAASSMLQVGQEVSGIGPWLLDELHRDVMLHSLNDWDIYIYVYYIPQILYNMYIPSFTHVHSLFPSEPAQVQNIFFGCET